MQETNTYAFEYHTNRWQAPTTIKIEKNDDGWFIHAVAHSGQANREGAPNFFSNLEQDGVNYPKGLDGFLEHAWGEIDRGAWTKDEAQQRLQQLADWISACERAEPRWPGWN